MTIVEFFDHVSIDNMASCLAMKPQKIIFIGENKIMRAQTEAYRRLACSRNIDVEFSFKTINKNSIEKIISVLTEIVETEDSCVFDLTGGEDLVLVAMGIVFEKYRNTGKIQMHRFNIKNGCVYDCDSDGELPDIERPKLTVKENVMLYGGCVVPLEGDKGTYEWIFDDDFEHDLKSMWEICRNNPGLWNAQTATFSYISKIGSKDSSELEFAVPKAHLEEVMKAKKQKFVWLNSITKTFERIGIITDLQCDDTIAFKIKNQQVKACLTKEGLLLELMVYMFARSAKNKDGTLKYNDVLNGVYIDWDATLHNLSDEEKDTENEIDVLMMNGMIPVFVSCKNGHVDENELYKLNTVATRFGGPYAKKVLVASYFGKSSSESQKYFAQRCKDMKIELIQNVHQMSENEFAKRIKNIVS